MIKFFSKKTPLEGFCRKFTLKKLSASHQRNLQNGELGNQFAAFYLFLANHLLESIQSEKRLKHYLRSVNVDVLILETIIYIDAVHSYSLMDTDLLDEDDVSSHVSTALSGALSVVEEFTNFTNTKNYVLSRGYHPNLRESTEKFSMILEFSVNLQSPPLKPIVGNFNLDTKNNIENHLSLAVITAAFSQTTLKTSLDVMQKIIEEYLCQHY